MHIRKHLALMAVYTLLAGTFGVLAARGQPVLWMLSGASFAVLCVLVLLFVTDTTARPDALRKD
jgi:hypothetical protein